MTTFRFDTAAVLLFDPHAAMRRASRAALEDMGFAHITPVGDLRAFSHKLDHDAFDLIIAEAFMDHHPVYDTVRAIREGDLCDNPFVSVLLTCWPRPADDIRRALDTGADDLLLRPFSAAQLCERIQQLAASARPYVVTSDYIGPDRRRGPARTNASPGFRAPNLLRARAEGRPRAVATAIGAIPDLRQRMARERIRRLAARIALSARERAAALAAGDADESLGAPPLGVAGLEDMDRTARELRRRVRATGDFDALEETCSDITELTTLFLRHETASLTQLEHVAAGALRVRAAIDAAEPEPQELEAAAVAAPASAAPASIFDDAGDEDLFDLDSL